MLGVVQTQNKEKVPAPKSLKSKYKPRLQMGEYKETMNPYFLNRQDRHKVGERVEHTTRVTNAMSTFFIYLISSVRLGIFYYEFVHCPVQPWLMPRHYCYTNNKYSCPPLSLCHPKR